MLVRNLILLCAAVLVLAACRALPLTSVVGSAGSATQSYDFADFDRLELSHGFAAEITAGDGYQVEVTVNDNLVDYLQVEQQGRTVKIGLQPYTVVSNTRLQARITLPVLVSLGASGGSRTNLTGFASGESMQFNLSGGSQVQGDMTTGDMSANLSGASNLAVEGRGGAVRVTAAGASTADLGEFAAGDVDVEASGASRVEVNASGTLNARASGASTVLYTGNPALGRIDESGASTVRGE